MDAARMMVLGTRGLPLAWTLRSYDRTALPRDVVAGLTVAALIVPLSIGYAQVAGLPPEFGLYASLAPLVAYALLGSSRRLIIGPDAATAALVGATIAPLAVAADARAELAAGLGLLVGLIFVAMRLASLGYLANLLSKPILVGYLAGVGINVAIGQIPKILGDTPISDLLDVVGGVGTVLRPGVLLEAFAMTFQDIDLDGPSIVLGVLVILAMAIGGRLLPRVPMALVTLIGALVASYALDLQALGVQVLGPVPGGFPPIAVPSLTVDQAVALLPGAIGLAVLSFADTAATGRTFSEKDGEETDPDRELVALAAADLAGSLTGGYPISASPSRTGASEAAGSRTQLTGLVAAGTVLAVLLFLTGPMAYLPTPALAAVILVSAVRFIDLAGIRAFYVRRTSEGVIATIALLGVLVYGTLAGVAIAVLLATLNVFRRAASPQILELGRVAGTTHFANLERWTDVARVEGVAVLRFSGPLFFANAGSLRDRVLELVAARPDLRAVVVDMRAVSDIDITAVEVLTRLVERLDGAAVVLMLVRTPGIVRTELVAGGLGDRLAIDAPVAVSVAEAIEHLGLDLDRVADVVQERAEAAGPTAEREPMVVAHRFAVTRSAMARTVVAIAGLALIVGAGAILLRPDPGESPPPTIAGSVAVPNIIGLSESRAGAVVTRAGLSFGEPIPVRLPDRPEGTVVAQDPSAGSSVEPSSTVVATISTRRDLVGVPDLVGMTEAEALVALTSVGLKLTGIDNVPAPTAVAGQVVDTVPTAGTIVAVGTGVDISVAAELDAAEPQPTPTPMPSP
ncbi:MAG: SulP family inorganic anion transporter [Candidatus Limnocylindrales bacterium]